MATELVDYFVRSYTLVIDNEQGTHEEALRVTREAILDTTPDITREAYRAMSDGDRRLTYAEAIGTRVLSLVEEWVYDLVDQFDDTNVGVMLTKEAMYLNGSSLAWELGAQYIPESHYDSDIDFLPEADDEDEVTA